MPLKMMDPPSDWTLPGGNDEDVELECFEWFRWSD